MKIYWSDIYVIAELLHEHHSTTEPHTLSFTALHSMICELPGFADEPTKSNEKILEAIQAEWIQERES